MDGGEGTHLESETPEFNSNLAFTFSTWLALFFNLGTAPAPTIVAAYRLGSAAAAQPNVPRDIILQFMYAKEREAVLHVTRNVFDISFKGSKILFCWTCPLKY